MTEFTNTLTPPGRWGEICSDQRLFLASRPWHELLEASHRAHTSYWWSDSDSVGAAVTAFPAGPFRVGYLGFPVGGLVGNGSVDLHVLLRQLGQARGARPVALRIPVSAFDSDIDLNLPCAETPETAIVDLQSWSPGDASLNHRRDVQKALRSEVVVEDAASEGQGADIFAIYKATLQRHGGGLRYNAGYFKKLVSLASNDDNARVMLARHGGAIVGFLAVVRHGENGYYLHGGMRRDRRQVRPSALLMHEAIEWARESGCRRFSLMSSPPGQDTLVRYKEKWGAETRPHRTYTLRLSATYAVFRALERLYRLVR